MAKPKFNFNQERLAEIERMAKIGMPSDKIALVIGCSKDTIERNEDAFAAVLRGKSNGDDSILKTAFHLAVEEKNVTMLIFLMKTRLRMSEKNELEVSGPDGSSIQHTFESKDLKKIAEILSKIEPCH